MACLLGVGEGVSAAIVGDRYIALLNVNVGSSVFSHRAQLHKVAVRLELLSSQTSSTGHDCCLKDCVVCCHIQEAVAQGCKVK